MAIVTLAPHVTAISGTVGDLTYVPLGSKQTVRHRMRRMRRTAGQNAQPRRMKAAALYWRLVRNTPELKAFYAALPHVPSLGAYQLAVRDFLNAPAVDEIDVSAYTGQVGQPIGVQASDDTGVSEVKVQIRAMDGTLVEEGFASLATASDRRGDAAATGGNWVYLSTVKVTPGETVSVRVTAKDRPGNTCSGERLAYAH